MTMILLASSLTMVLGVAAAQRNDRAKTVRWLLLTALGGLAVHRSALDRMDQSYS